MTKNEAVKLYKMLKNEKKMDFLSWFLLLLVFSDAMLINFSILC